LPAATPAPTLDLAADSLVLGTSIEGRPIVADRFGPVGGRRVLVIGVIHGNEDGGVPIIEQLRARAENGDLPTDVEWWLVDSMNPDGQTAQDRHNANQVDLNRNFPLRWGPIGAPGDGQYAGTGPASEPETQAMVAFISLLRPDMAIWYHQDANLIIPSSGRDGRVRARYAELSGLPVDNCCDGGIYTGIAATWARDELADQNGVPFIVELPGGDLPIEQVTVHADTVATIATELGVL
jgi:protein MpaA